MGRGTKAALGLLAILFITAILFPSISPSRGAGPTQPINFSHKVHAGQYKIDCQYCHTDARRSPYAGIPSVERCIGCHKITAADRPEVQKVQDYFRRQQPIPWVRLNKLAGFVYFPHKRHVKAEISCQTCHGPVETMEVVEQVAPLTMGWCVECHTKPQGPKGLKGPLDCMMCHH